VSRVDVYHTVQRWVQILGLTTWDLHVVWPEEYDKWPENTDDFGEFGPHDHARIWRAKDYEMARLYVNPAMMSAEYPGADAAMETAIVHELLHLVTREAEFVLDQLDGLLHRDVDDLISMTFRHHMEGMVDKMAYILVRLSRQIRDNL
jgi:hypothetical protein